MNDVRWSATDLARALDQPSPTPEQIAVIEAPLEPQLIVAGAGSGKTETMTSRVVWLVANRLVSPEEVLGLTFTRKAAGELSARVAARLASLNDAGIWSPPQDSDAFLGVGPAISTYHSYAGALVREHALRLGYERDARMLSEAAAWQLAHEVVVAYDGPMGEVEQVEATVTNAVLALAGEMSEHLLSVRDIDQYLERQVSGMEAIEARDSRRYIKEGGQKILATLRRRRQILPIVERYLSVKRERNAMDFADQMALAARLARRFGDIGALQRETYRVVLLDEFQDTSEAQLVLMRELFAPEGGPSSAVTAVGDPHQSIYAWRGASATTLATFPQVFRARREGGDEPAPVRPLSTSWRNDRLILAVANAIAEPLRASSPIPVEGLHPREGAHLGQVEVLREVTSEQEADRVAEWISQRRGKGASARSAAVLCRKRSQFAPIAEALDRHGVPYEVVGLGGLLQTAEVSDVVSLLAVVADPTRGDRLMRLLTGPVARLGAADIAGLGARAADLRPARTAAPTTDLAPDSNDDVTIVDALDELPEPGWRSRDGRTISDTGLARLRELAAIVRRLREQSGLALPDLVGEAERALGIDLEVLSRPGWSPGAARSHLDAFADVAAQFAASADRPTLGAFVSWIEAALEREDGLDAPTVEVSADAVQILTCHAAKGLEWDVVAVPGLVEGSFPAHPARARWVGNDEQWVLGAVTDGGWLTGLDGGVPYALRGDRDGLPELDLTVGPDTKAVEAAASAFRAAGGEHGVVEERRLAYVATTRARHQLLLSGATWVGRTRTPRLPSRFVTEIVGETPGDGAPTITGVRVVDWCETPPEGLDNPIAAAERVAVWPQWSATPEHERLSAAADAIIAASSSAIAPSGGGAIDRELDLLLAERRERLAHRVPSVDLPAHLTTSSLVALARDPQAYALDVRRPLPQPPSASTRRGTAFHAWVEEHYQRSAIVDLDDLPGSADQDLDDEDLEAMKERFLASEWATRTPLEVELSLETVIAGRAVRGRVDAVFASEGGGVIVVDWKSGRPATGPDARVRALQLAAYRVAYARWRDIPLEQVRAAFYYASTGETHYPDLLGVEQIEQVVTGGD